MCPGSVKSRLGTKDDAVVQRERRHRDDSSDAENLESVVIIEEVDDDDENEEEERLRKFAIKSLDLRGRINTNVGFYNFFFFEKSAWFNICLKSVLKGRKAIEGLR